MAYLCYGVDPNAPIPAEEDGKAAAPARAATDDDVMGVLLEDLNGDGLDDMIVLTREGVPAYVYLNPGDGDFSDVTLTPVGTGGIAPATDMGFNTDAAVADVNGDGLVDIVVANDGTSNMIYLGQPAPNRGDFSGVVGLPFGSRTAPRPTWRWATSTGRRARHRGGQRRHAQRHLLGRADCRRHRPELRWTAGRRARRRHERQRPVAVVDDRSARGAVVVDRAGRLDNDGDIDIVVGNGGGDQRVHLNPAQPRGRARRPSRRRRHAAGGLGGQGDDGRGVAGGTDPSTSAPLDINMDGIPDIVPAVDGGHNLIYYGTSPTRTTSRRQIQPRLACGTDGSGNPEDPIKETQTVVWSTSTATATRMARQRRRHLDHVLQRWRHIQL